MSTKETQEEQVAGALLGAGHVIALTGAGISVPSGIPDFRSPEGLWARFDIMEYGTIDAFHRTPYKVWKLFKEIGAVVDRAKPNPAHTALVRLEELGLLNAVITQNIDGLHQEAGSQEVIEFHGSARSFTCLECSDRCSREDADARLDDDGIPHCTCGRPLKPDIVLFGETIPGHAMQSSFDHAQAADLVLVVGTSALVAPASMLPSVVSARGGRIVEMNVTHTGLSSMADYQLLGNVARTLPSLVRVVEELM